MKNKDFTVQGNGQGLYRIIRIDGIKFVEAITDYKFKTKDEAKQYLVSLYNK